MGITDVFDLVPWVISAIAIGAVIYMARGLMKSWRFWLFFADLTIVIIMAVLGVSAWKIALFVVVEAICWFLLYGEGRSQDLL